MVPNRRPATSAMAWRGRRSGAGHGHIGWEGDLQRRLQLRDAIPSLEQRVWGTRRAVRSLRDLPHFPERVSGEHIIPTATALLDSDTDADAWLRQLLASGAGYLVIAKNDAGPHPPEIPLARADREHFRPVFEDENYVIFQVINAR